MSMSTNKRIVAGVLVAGLILAVLTGWWVFHRNEVPKASFTATAAEAPWEFQFDGSASEDGDGEIVAYAWDFGDGRTDTGPSPTHTYARAGTFKVRLTVTDDRGATHLANQTVTAQPRGLEGDEEETGRPDLSNLPPVLARIEPADGAVVRGTEAWIHWRPLVETKGRARPRAAKINIKSRVRNGK